MAGKLVPFQQENRFITRTGFQPGKRCIWEGMLQGFPVMTDFDNEYAIVGQMVCCVP